MNYTVLTRIASQLEQRTYNKKRGHEGQAMLCEARIREIVDDFMPSGSGIDSGTKMLESRTDRIVFQADFHHMNEHGSYDGWTEHTVVVTPAFTGPHIRITGRDRNQIKDYLADLYDGALAQPIKWDTVRGRYVRDAVALGE